MKVKTLTPVQYDGKDIKVGAVIEVTDKAGEQLVDSGAAEAVGKKAAGESAVDLDKGDK